MSMDAIVSMFYLARSTLWQWVKNCLQIAIASLTTIAHAGEPIAQPESSAGDRPKIALVLGGGGAKGAAHIGVLEVLDELHIPIDCVAGTSMGALVGATFASGMPPTEINRSVMEINWSKAVGTEGLRDRTPINQKLQNTAYTNSLELGVQGGSIVTPGGLLKTQDIEDVIRSLVADARFTQHFDDLPIPFRAVATDMVAGQMVVLESGDVSIAMRASMAVPGAFSPVIIDDMILSDGGQLRNLPVDIARELCGSDNVVVIAVSLKSPPPDPAKLTTAVALAGRSLDVMIDANTAAQLATLTERDVSIVVPMGDIGSGSFDRVPDAIPLGREAAQAMIDQLSRYAVPKTEYVAWRTSITRADSEAVQLADVRIKGLINVNENYVRQQLQNVKPGARVTTTQITDDTSRIYALGDFEKVEYALSGPAEARVLEISPIEKSWGPDILRLDLGLATQVEGETQVIIRADYNRAWVNRYGGQWHSTLQFGSQALLATDFYQPLDISQRFFVRPSFTLSRELQDLYFNGSKVADYEIREYYGQFDLGMNFGTRAQLFTGLRTGNIEAKVDTGPALLPEIDTERDTSAVTGLIYDTRNNPGLPTSGTLLNLLYRNSGSSFGGEQNYSYGEGVVKKSFPWRGDSLTLAVAGGKEMSGELTPVDDFTVGGIRSFPGLQPGELRGTSYWLAGTAYYWKLSDIQTLFDQALYAGLRYTAARVGEPVDGNNRGTLRGIATSLSGRTPVGPFLLSLGYVNDNTWALQFAFGRPISEGNIADAR
jgi:NTE family protein